MILHIVNSDSFIPPFIEFINKNFDSSKHEFIITEKRSNIPFEFKDNVNSFKSGKLNTAKNYLDLSIKMIKSEKIILHNLFNYKLILMLACMPWILKRCHWVIWGGDLYSYQKPKENIKARIKEFLKSFVVQRIGFLLSYIPGDIELARKWYKAKGKYQQCLMYLSNTIDERHFDKVSQKHKKNGETVNIIVGNSADPSNNHIEILKKLLAYKNKNIRIIAPLSYGDKEHAKKVISYGRQEFGRKFEAITDFIPLSEYKHILKSTDIAMFNHKRQQAMGNTITLLGMGKTVYLRSDVTQWSLFKELGVIVKDINEAELFSQLAYADSERNIEIIKSYFNSKTLLTQYERIFDE